jgi:hypothetical protein
MDETKVNVFITPDEVRTLLGRPFTNRERVQALLEYAREHPFRAAWYLGSVLASFTFIILGVLVSLGVREPFTSHELTIAVCFIGAFVMSHGRFLDRQ